MITFENYLRTASRVLALVALAGLLGLAMMTTLDVVMRWLFKAPIQGVNDVSSVVMAVVIAACLPANFAFRQNITVTLLGSACGPKVSANLNVLASLITMIFAGLMAWAFVPYAISTWESGAQTWVLRMPLWPFWVAAAFFVILAALAQLVVLLSDLVALARGGARLADAEEPTAL